MYKKIHAIFPIGLLRPQTQKDFASIYLTLQLMMESFADRLIFNTGYQKLDTIDAQLEVNISRGATFFSISYLDVFEKEAREYFNQVLYCKLEKDFIESHLQLVKLDTLEELKGDSAKTKVTDLLFKRIFKDYHHFADAGTIKTVKQVEIDDILFWFEKINKTDFIQISNDGVTEFKNLSNSNCTRTVLSLEKARIKNPSEYYKLEYLSRKHIRLNAIFKNVLHDTDEIYALEKFLRNELKTEIEVFRQVLPGLCIIKIYFFDELDSKPLSFEELKAREDNISRKLFHFFTAEDEEVAEYMDFGAKKYNAQMTSSATFCVNEIWNKILFESGCRDELPANLK